MTWTREQRHAAQVIRQEGRRSGLRGLRIRELIQAALSESGLDPDAQGPAVHHSGYGGRRAGGLFQLLSSGYVDRANELGGVFKPRANVKAILPSYLKFWRDHPNARPGEAAVAVERSGQGADFYWKGGRLKGLLRGGGLRADRARQAASGMETPEGMDRQSFALSLLSQGEDGQQGSRPGFDLLDRFLGAEKAQAAPRPSQDGQVAQGPGGGLVSPLSTPLPEGNAFGYADPEGASGGHYALDWFAPAGSTVRAPAGGRVVEVKRSKGRSGQVFGGTVKIERPNGRVWVFRHVDPGNLRAGQRVRAGTPIARVTDWTGGGDHSHLELWKRLSGGYTAGNMLDPWKVLRRYL